MDTQLDEQLVYSGESLFEQSDKSYNYNHGSSLPELKLKDGDTAFPDNLTSGNNSGQSISHMTFLTDPLPISLPDIESSFAPTTSQDRQHDSPRFHPYRGPRDNEIQGERLPEYHETCPTLYQSTAVANSENYEQYQQTTRKTQYVTNHQPHTVEKNSAFFDVSQPQWSEASAVQYALNSNNNNINQIVTHNGIQTAYHVAKLQNVPGTIENMENGTSSVSVSNSRYQSLLTQIPRVNHMLPRTGNREARTNNERTSEELIGAKFSPDRKNRTKRRKKRSPNEPQKPVSAYALFFRDTQANIKVENPNATFGEISKIVASMWDSLSDSSKQIYKQKTETAKRDYLKQLAAYRANLISKGGLETESEEDRSSNFQMFKNNQRSSTSLFHTSPSKLPIISHKAAREIHHPPMVYDLPNSSEQHKLGNINIICEGGSAAPNHANFSQHSGSSSHFMVRSGADNLSTQE